LKFQIYNEQFKNQNYFVELWIFIVTNGFFVTKMKLLKILIKESRYKEASQIYRPYIDAEVEASFESDGSNLNMLTTITQ